MTSTGPPLLLVTGVALLSCALLLSHPSPNQADTTVPISTAALNSTLEVLQRGLELMKVMNTYLAETTPPPSYYDDSSSSTDSDYTSDSGDDSSDSTDY